MITVVRDAPEDFKELKERRLAKRRIMTIKSSRRRTLVRVPPKKKKRTALTDNPYLLVEVAGKREKNS